MFLRLSLALALLTLVPGIAHALPQPNHARLRGTEVFPAGMKRAPLFSLRDQTGRRVSLRSLRGHLVAITFLDSKCTQQCPVVGAALAAAQRRLGSRSPLTTLIVSVAPGVDTPRLVKRFAHKVHLSGSWHWLLGTKGQLAPVWNEYGIWVRYTKADVLHTAAVFLVDRRGSVRVADAAPFILSQFVSDVRILSAAK